MGKLRFLLFLTTVLAIFFLVSGYAWAEDRVALVIGNGAYRNTPLANPVNDAKLMANTLRGLGFHVLESLNADQKTLKRAVTEFGDKLEAAGKDAAGLFYYAGHGVQVGDTNYLIPIGAEINREKDVDIEAVSANAVLANMEFAGNRVNIVIMDACRNNPFKRGFRSAARGLARMSATTGTLIAYATGPGDVAADGTGTNSAYTLALSRAMITPGLTVERMFKQVRNEVLAKTNNLQTPWESSSLTGADFYFKGGSATVAAPASPTPQPQSTMTRDMMAWQSIQNSANAEEVEAFIQAFSDSPFAGMARAKLKLLKKQQQAAMVVPPKPKHRPNPVQPAVGVYFNPGETFRDCAGCPEMVVIPSGSFRMGDVSGGGISDEKPIHRVTIPNKFTVSKYEVTFAQWDACVSAGGCSHRPEDRGWGRGNRPVIYISWDDAKEYVSWLSRKVGKKYRLLSSAEWEYAARAGTTTKYHFGNGIAGSQANYRGSGNNKTVSVGNYSSNSFGLHDMHGNVWEWVEDCWHDSYNGAPMDDNAWTSGGDCSMRVLRGGSWNSKPKHLRSANRKKKPTVSRSLSNGFRIARTP